MAGSRLDFSTGAIVNPFSQTQSALESISNTIGSISKRYLDKQQHEERMAESKLQHEDAQSRFAQELALNREKFNATNALAQNQEKRLNDEYQHQLDERTKVESAKKYLGEMAAGGYLKEYNNEVTNKEKTEAGKYGDAAIAQVYKRLDYAVENAPDEKTRAEAMKARDLVTSTLVSNNAAQKQTQWALDNPNAPLLPGQEATLKSVSGVNKEDIYGKFFKNALDAGANLEAAAASAEAGVNQVMGGASQLSPKDQIEQIKLRIDAAKAMGKNNDDGKVNLTVNSDSSVAKSSKENSKNSQVSADNFNNGPLESIFGGGSSDAFNDIREKLGKQFPNASSKQINEAAGEIVMRNSTAKKDSVYESPSKSKEDMVADASTLLATRLAPKSTDNTGQANYTDASTALLMKAYNDVSKIGATGGRVPETDYTRELAAHDAVARDTAEKNYEDYQQRAQALQNALTNENGNANKVINTTVTPNSTVPLTQNSLVTSFTETGKVQPEEIVNYAEILKSKGVDPTTIKYASERASKNNDITELLRLNPEYNISENSDWLGSSKNWLNNFILSDKVAGAKNTAMRDAVLKGAKGQQVVEASINNPDVIRLTEQLAQAKKLQEDADFIRRLQTLPTTNVRNLLKQTLEEKSTAIPDPYKTTMGWSLPENR